jgi:hypothetical protein
MNAGTPARVALDRELFSNGAGKRYPLSHGVDVRQACA